MAKKAIKLAAPVVTAAKAEALAQGVSDKAAKAHMGNARVGGKPHAMRYAELSLSYRVGHIMGTLDCDEKRAIAVLDKATHEGEGKAKTGQARRTKAEQLAYGAAATGLSRLCARCNIVSPLQHKRNLAAQAEGKAGAATGKAGNRSKAGQGKAKAPDKAPLDRPVKYKTREAVHAEVERLMAAALLLVNKNGDLVATSVAQAVSKAKTEVSMAITNEAK